MVVAKIEIDVLTFNDATHTSEKGQRCQLAMGLLGEMGLVRPRLTWTVGAGSGAADADGLGES